MEGRRLFRRDGLGAGVFGVVFGTTIALFTWWADPAFAHDTRWALLIGVAFSAVVARRAYYVGVQPAVALVAFAGLVLGGVLVFRPFDPGVTTDHLAEAAVVLAIGLGGLYFSLQVTPEQAERLSRAAKTGGLIWRLPLGVARLVFAVMSLAICSLVLVALH